MEAKDRAILQKNAQSLVKRLNIDTIRIYLHSKFILNQNDMDLLSKQNSTENEKMELLVVHILPKRGPAAYAEFVNALKSDGHYPDVIEMMEKTILSDEDIKRAVASNQLDELHRESAFYLENSEKVKCGNETYSVQWDLNELYGNSGKLTAAKMEKVTDFSNAFEGDLDKLFQNSQQKATKMTIEESKEQKWKKSDGLEGFRVTLKSTESSERTGFEPGSYLINISMEGVALISSQDYEKTLDIDMCRPKALWTFDVIRRFAADGDKVLLELGQNSCTEEGRFIFKVDKKGGSQDIVLNIKKYVKILSENNNPLFRSVRRPSIPVIDLNC